VDFGVTGVHVIPAGDVVSHDTDEMDACVCGPDVEFVNGGWVSVHHSLDGREAIERLSALRGTGLSPSPGSEA
jgi:hypothetical protein